MRYEGNGLSDFRTFGLLKHHKGNGLSDFPDFRTTLYKNKPFLYKNEPFKAGFVFSFDNTKYNRTDMIFNHMIILAISRKLEILKSAVANALIKQQVTIIATAQTMRHLAQTLNLQLDSYTISFSSRKPMAVVVLHKTLNNS